MTDLATTPQEALVARVQELSERVEALADPVARELADELAGAIVEMYGDGLQRIFAVLEDDDPAVARAREELTRDGAVASLMLMHGLYPVSLETRVMEALEEVRPYLESHEGNVELLGVQDGVARLKLLGSCDGCGASAATLEHAIEEALIANAPDLLGLEVEGAVPARAVTPGSQEARSKTWVALEGTQDIQRGHMVRATQGLLVANVAGTLLAYEDHCAGCPAPLSAGVLLGGTLTCASCGRAYDLPRAGRSKGDDGLQLVPVPLLRGKDGVKVAVEEFDDVSEQQDGTCELCPSGLSDDHRHLLHLDERRILCVCETCWSIRSGDAEYRPTGSRTLWLDDFTLPDDVWAAFNIPTGLAFVMRSSVSGGMVALYPSPAGATECELELAEWDRLVELNPVIDRIEPDAEALIINRLARGTTGEYVIAPIDQCYRLVGVDQGRLGGDQRRQRRRQSRRRVLRPAATRTRGGRVKLQVIASDGRRRPGGGARRRRTRLHGPRRRVPAVRGHSDAALPPARERPGGPAGPRDRAVHADPDPAGAAHVRPGDAGAARRAVRRARALVGDHASVPVGAYRGAGPRLHRCDVLRCRGPVHLRPRDRQRQVLQRPA